VERERARDDDVIALGTKPSEYASHLVDITKLMPSNPTAPVATLAVLRGPQLKGRVMSILDHNNRNHSKMTLMAPTVWGMTVLAVSLGGLRLASARPVHQRASVDLRAAAEVSGVWTAEQTGDKVHLRLATPSKNDWSCAVTIPTSEFASSTTDPSPSFQLHRDAGVVFFEGRFDDTTPIRRGSGSFSFHGDPGYIQEMKELGFQLADHERLLAFALLDVPLAYTREICSLGYDDLSADQLLGFRTHGVTPEFIRELAEAGYADVAPDQLVVCRIHDVTPEFIRELADLGYADLPLAQLIAFRIHGVSPEFIGELAVPAPTELTPAQRIVIDRMGPGFIRDTTDRTQGCLSVAELIRLRIHGCDR
jgi:hypothetical protein